MRVWQRMNPGYMKWMILSLALMACGRHLRPASEKDLDSVLARFAEERLEYQIRGDDPPADHDHLRDVLHRSGIDPESFAILLRNKNPLLHKRFFPGT